MKLFKKWKKNFKNLILISYSFTTALALLASIDCLTWLTSGTRHCECVKLKN